MQERWNEKLAKAAAEVKRGTGSEFEWWFMDMIRDFRHVEA
jgi:sulfur relay (sulfurtransferase) DsrC/TusE family protein